MRKSSTTKHCVVCGAPYQAQRSSAHKRFTCSFKCSGVRAAETRADPKGATVTRACAHCGTEVARRYSPSKGTPRRVFCNSECQRAWRSPTVTLKCDRCGKEFERLTHRHEQRNKGMTFCSDECRLDRVKRTCEVCGKNFTSTHYDAHDRANRWCSMDCKAIGWATVPKPCEQCGKDFKPSHSRSRFCTHSCYADWLSESGFMSGENSPNWQGGLGWNNTRGPSWARQRRKALRRDKYRCVRCGVHKNDTRRLCVHHLIPYRVFDGDHEAANELRNLATMCDPCHTTTEWELRAGGRLF